MGSPVFPRPQLLPCPLAFVAIVSYISRNIAALYRIAQPVSTKAARRRGERPMAAFGPSRRSFHRVFRFSSWVLGRTESPWKEAVSWPRVPCSRLDGCCHTLRCEYRPRFLLIRVGFTLVPLQERLMREKTKSHRRLTLDALITFHDPSRSPCPGSGSWCWTVALI